ncbi:membrane protein [Kordiimonas sediminis]|uniref:Membrane protein n=1 Tax=Kordiimonas sediminis TaxID=1735581 RepID=A0A919E4L6_9PROT|nr:hypothetical protein [Kordiimonas sediminis]GHF19164.1 membrane protein [Kordiimonas sediminis]
MTDSRRTQSGQNGSLHDRLTHSVRYLKRRTLLSALLRLLAVAAFVVMVMAFFKMPIAVKVATPLLVVVTGLLLLPRHRGYREISVATFLLHLNRKIPELEESGQLLLADRTTLPPLKQLQFDRAEAAFERAVQDHSLWVPPLKAKTPIALTLLFLMLAVALYQYDWRKTARQNMYEQTAENVLLPASITEATVTVTAPPYTNLAPSVMQDLNIKTVEASQIMWRLKFSRMDGRYMLHASDGELVPFTADTDGSFRAEMIADSTGLYRIMHSTSDGEAQVGDFYTLQVFKDRAPDIDIREPEKRVLEIPKNGDPFFRSIVEVRDDFGVAGAQILASVAKGTGEAVKFRDEVFSFDQQTTTENGYQYSKDWDLLALGMEPGDEVYFSVEAWDNKTPTPNRGKSSTVIVKWLDDVEVPVAAAGIVINLEPEYFKSQRQIIIETEQLIEDQSILDAQEFKDISYGLGQAQSDLKQRYGQYLGDEFGEGPGDQLAEAGRADTGADDDHEEGHDHGHEEAEVSAPEVGHTHEGADQATSRSGAAEMIARFGHNHGDSDVGPIAKRDPKTLMKKAVSIMWQAELHLMLAEPEKALPYEYEALKFLKLAKQADRIYVKRLGFEPPPVSEDRRLTGELDDIESFRRDEAATPENDRDEALLLAGYKLLSNPERETALLSEQTRQTLTDLKDYFLQAAQDRPALITHVATLEKLIATRSLALADCDDCVTGIQRTLWHLLKDPIAQPSVGQQYYLHGDQIISDGVSTYD